MHAQGGSWYVMWGRGVQLHLNTNCTYMYILQEQSPFFFGNGSRFLTLASQPVSTDSFKHILEVSVEVCVITCKCASGPHSCVRTHGCVGHRDLHVYAYHFYVHSRKC